MAGSVSSESGEGDLGFQIAPMVDIVFVVMLFFMASAGMQIVEQELGINLPGDAVPGSGPTPIIIEVFTDGNVAFQNTKVDAPDSKELPQLREKLRDLVARFGGKDPVIIKPDPTARHQRVIDVLNAAAAAGVKNLTFS